MEPQRSQRNTLCPQREFSFKKIANDGGACGMDLSVRDEDIIKLKAVRRCTEKINIFSVSSVVIF